MLPLATQARSETRSGSFAISFPQQRRFSKRLRRPTDFSNRFYVRADTLEGALLKATAAMIMPRIPLFQSVAPLTTPNTNGERISQMPRIAVIQLQPGWFRVLQRTMARTPTAIPVATLLHVAFGDGNARTKGEIITQIPSRIFSQLLLPLFRSAMSVCRPSINSSSPI